MVDLLHGSIMTLMDNSPGLHVIMVQSFGLSLGQRVAILAAQCGINFIAYMTRYSLTSRWFLLNSKSVACYWSQVRYCELYPMVLPSLPVLIRHPVSCDLGCGTLFTCPLEQWHWKGTSSHMILCIWCTMLMCMTILSYPSICNLSVQRCVVIYQQTRVNLLIDKSCKWYWHFLLLSMQKVGVGHVSALRYWMSSKDYAQTSTDCHDAHS